MTDRDIIRKAPESFAELAFGQGDYPQRRASKALAALARLEAQQAEGWRLVPVEPTGPMRTAGHRNGLDQGISYFDGPMAGSIYSAMLSAAPSPSAKGEGESATAQHCLSA